MGIRYHFNTKYFIINSKITALCNRNHSVVLAYIYTRTDGRIADCTGRHPGVERPFSSRSKMCILNSALHFISANS